MNELRQELNNNTLNLILTTRLACHKNFIQNFNGNISTETILG